MHRKKKIVPGSLMKAVIRPGGGEVTPADGDQVGGFFVLNGFVSWTTSGFNLRVPTTY